MGDGTYQVDLKNYVSGINRLTYVDGKYSYSTGITKFSYESTSVSYKYNVKAPRGINGYDDLYTMYVTFRKIQPVITTMQFPDTTLSSEYSYTLESRGGTYVIWTLEVGLFPKGYH